MRESVSLNFVKSFKSPTPSCPHFAFAPRPQSSSKDGSLYDVVDPIARVHGKFCLHGPRLIWYTRQRGEMVFLELKGVGQLTVEIEIIAD